jgi:1,4-dihydroxy-2-naphthoyl-CoA synthase
LAVVLAVTIGGDAEGGHEVRHAVIADDLFRVNPRHRESQVENFLDFAAPTFRSLDLFLDLGCRSVNWVVIATESASFIQAFSKIGLVPDSGGTFYLPRLIGMQKASALMMLGDKISAAEAANLNMIYKYLSDATFESEAWKIAQTLASMPTKGLGLTKRLLNQSFSNSLSQQLHFEGELQVEAANSYDYQEGVNAFLEKRKPLFKGE